MEPTADRYRRAAVELAQTSELQVEWALAVAGDGALLALIDELPPAHRQPSLLFSVARLLGAPAVDGAAFAEWLRREWPRVAPVAAERLTQTNEALRCAPLVAALERITEPGEPVALIEIGASAGLCLAPERYSYVFTGAQGTTRLGRGEPVLECAVTGGAAPSRLPVVAWRRGLDLRPLDVGSAEDRAWLEALLPPDRPERTERLRAAVATLREDPPAIVAGDAAEALPEVLAAVPRGLRTVVVSLGTLVYLPWAARERVLATVAESGASLVTLEAEALLPSLRERTASLTAPERTPFLLAADGVPLAFAAPHGGRLSWLS
ncbi:MULTISPECIES: DUF2332 domain-containing protein [unclassified Rathayibacter]|uniref:DUF2332 domain-containing protein n=1 Tax=unclassified Rathayibacter TaxID=2609250 RepID=UPI000F4C2584|nr:MULTISPECIES: DUF2332 domain-containing protein [unclassified Rathayibacter]ROP56629.1 uncharacterized protein DUF2332 [Rathayibacter sp. PhB186]ROS55014.1 uncharacterized protein DUF2332 [Rathayibacter sp. PhB185]